MNDMEVYHLMKGRVKRVSKRIAYRHGVSADDVEQDSWECIFRSVRRNEGIEIKEPARYLSRVFRTSATLAIRFVKKHGIVDSLDDDNSPSFTESHDFITRTNPFTGVTRKSLELLARHYCGRETLEEIGASTGRSRQAVHLAHGRAIEKIRENLGVTV